MNTKLLSLAVLSASLVASPAFAAGANTPSAPTFVASAAPVVLSRAEVKNEARLAELSNQIPRGQQAWPDEAALTRSTLPRAEVKAETRVALAAHEIPRGQLPFGLEAQAPSTLSRASVKAEARLAEVNHLIPRGESNVSEARVNR